jgi:flagellar assembly factor FliW
MVLSDSEKNQLKIETTESVMIRVIVTIPKVHVDMTANLVAPLVINQKSKLAKQVVLTNAEYDTKYPLISQKEKETA